MGYYTNFKVSVDVPGVSNMLDEILTNATDYTFCNGHLPGAKWYSWKRDMQVISSTYPEALFSVEGYGEEEGDIWKAYFKDGKACVTMGEITFPKFTEDMLK